MAQLYSNENFPMEVVIALRALGHDVLTAAEAGNANIAIPDDRVLAFAVSNERVLLTINRWDFIRLHNLNPNHLGIVVCTQDGDPIGQASRIHQALLGEVEARGKLIRVNRPQR